MAIHSDVALKEATGMCGGLHRDATGYLVKKMHSFNSALIFVSASAIAAMFCYLLVVSKISRMDSKM